MEERLEEHLLCLAANLNWEMEGLYPVANGLLPILLHLEEVGLEVLYVDRAGCLRPVQAEDSGFLSSPGGLWVKPGGKGGVKVC